MKTNNLHDKTLLITGASSGIGRATALLFATMGAKCVITGRDMNRLNLVLDSLGGNGHLSVQADISTQDGIEKLCNESPQLDGVVHCAGVIKLMTQKFISLKAFDNIINVNLYAPFFITQLLLKKKKINNKASIVFISSISGSKVGSKGNLMYSASKSAINGIVKVLALELAEKKMRVNSIAAGMVKTEMWMNENMTISADQLTIDEKKYPLGYGQPEDVASVSAFLVSDAARWITGSNIIVDGGFTIQ